MCIRDSLQRFFGLLQLLFGLLQLFLGFLQFGLATFDIVKQIVDFGETAHGDFQSRQQLGFLIRLGDIRHGASARGLFDQIRLGECRQHDDRSDVLITDDASGLDAIHARHLDIHAHHARAELTGQLNGFLTVGGLSDDLIAVILKHGDQIHAVHGFVFGNDDGALVRLVIIGRIRLGSRSSLELLISEYFVRFRGLLCSHVGLFPLSHPKPA